MCEKKERSREERNRSYTLLKGGLESQKRKDIYIRLLPLFGKIFEIFKRREKDRGIFTGERGILRKL